MKIQVDPTKCQGYEICVEIAEDMFELDVFGFASPRGDGEVSEADRELALEARREVSC